MFNYKLYEHKTLYGMSYHFPKKGDGLPMHTHEEHQKHNVMVTKGSFEIYGPEKTWYFVLNSGDIFDLLDEHHPHEIVALEDDSIFVGMFVNGKPEGEDIPEDERQGTLYRNIERD